MCRLVGMRPHEARDLVRMLRAIIMAARFQCPFQLLLDVADRRTLDHLLRKSGLDEAKGVTPTLEHIFESQEFVARNAEGLKLLRRLLTMPEHR